MPAERIAMRLVREILRLIAVEKLPVREIARRTGKAPSTVRATLGRCRAAGVSWRCPSHRHLVSLLHVGRPNIGDKDLFLKLVSDVLDRRWLTNDGSLVRELERRISQKLSVKHCVAMNNATV